MMRGGVVLLAAAFSACAHRAAAPAPAPARAPLTGTPEELCARYDSENCGDMIRGADCPTILRACSEQASQLEEQDPARAAALFLQVCEATQDEDACWEAEQLGGTPEPPPDPLPPGADPATTMDDDDRRCQAEDDDACSALAKLFVRDEVSADLVVAHLKTIRSRCDDLGDTDACAGYDYVHAAGKGVPADLEKAFPHLRRDCENEDPGWICGPAARLIVGSQPELAHAMFQLACVLGDEDACKESP